MSIEYRSATKDEWSAFGKVVSRGFGGHPPTDQQSRDRWTKFYDVINSVGAWDDAEVVGTSGSFVSDTTVPGGAKLPTALVTIVTVAATHRRQGVMTNMMRGLLQGAQKRGEPIATLWASESVIYGRFGYGMAGQRFEAKIKAGKAQLTHLPNVTGTVNFVDRPQLREIGPDIWTRTAAHRPGMPERPDGSWDESHPMPEDDS